MKFIAYVNGRFLSKDEKIILACTILDIIHLTIDNYINAWKIYLTVHSNCIIIVNKIMKVSFGECLRKNTELKWLFIPYLHFILIYYTSFDEILQD